LAQTVQGHSQELSSFRATGGCGKFYVAGEETVTGVEEQHGTGLAPELLLPDRTPDALQKHRNWMMPDFFSEAEGKFIASILTWVVPPGIVSS
jgi:hypothetical protein